MNQVTLCGRLTSNLELKQSQTSGTVYTQFTLAVSDYRGKENTVDFLDVIAFGVKAEQLVKYMEKGRKILIAGRLNRSTHTNEQGNKRVSTKVVLEEFEFVDAKKEVAATLEEVQF